MDVLRYLCRHPGAVIPTEEILEACWGSSEMGDNPIHKAITQLRRALGDSASEPRYIETVRKRGYRAMAAVIANETAEEGSWLQGSPFRGLEAFQENHAAIFFGRMQACSQLRELVTKQTEQGSAMALVLGPSGSGKTSLVRAGLLPQLMEAQAGPTSPIALACTLYMDCADLAEGNLFQALAAVLIDAEVDGKLLFSGENAEALGKQLDSLDVETIAGRFDGFSGRIRISLFVDRLEAIFRAPGVTDEIRIRFVAVLEHLSRSGAILVMLACRNDFYPDVVALSALMTLKSRGGHFDLTPPDGADIAQIVRLPARAAQLHFEQDQTTGANLDDILCDAARGNPDTLPLLQYCLNELYRQRREDGMLCLEVFRQLGGIEGSIAVRAEQVVTALAPAQLSALPHVLSLLVDIAEEKGAITARRAAWSALQGANERDLVRALVEARLFVSELSGDVPSFGVAHEALLRRWPRVAEWIEKHRNALQVRTRLSLDADRWIAAGRPRDLLLPAGSQINQARGLMDLVGFSLAERELEYVQSSLRRVKLGERIKLLVMSFVVVLAILAGVLGLAARSSQQEAELHRIEAEGLMGYMLGEFVEKLRPLGRLDLLDGISSKALLYLAESKTVDENQTSLAQRAKALHLISEVNYARADLSSALKALTAARSILQKQDFEGNVSKSLLKDLGANSFWLGQIYLDRRDWALAGRHLEEYRNYSHRLVNLDPTDIDGMIEFAYSHNSLGKLALRRGNFDQAAAAFTTSVKYERDALARKPGTQNLIADLANSLSWLASTKARLGELNEAMSLYVQEEALLREIHATAPSNATWALRLATSMWRQGELFVALGTQGIAIEKLKNAEILFIGLSQKDPTNREWQLKLLAVQLRRIAAASVNVTSISTISELSILHEKLSLLSKLDPKHSELAQWTTSALQEKASAFLRMGHIQEAQSTLAGTITTLEHLYNGDKQSLSLTLNLVQALLIQAEIADARKNSAEVVFACKRAESLLSNATLHDSDFRALALQVRVYLCIGEEKKAAPYINKLNRMAYREFRYNQYISQPRHRKG
ncbi:Transcriptional regulatory protein, C terminal [Pseudoduganella namucuonensis]|uniref:Transcriptional regulatory protein, C terminal n=2 Tax=Pseudoduganella namucuonensis TaxID=1035707 RepID=A0A1I7HR81_9BURK|nr:Transcriptional regulatory protein, C terminal [Pseudoduganella namucuonensis]